MAAVTGGELVVRALRDAGVTEIFGLHGAHIDSIFQACLDDGLEILDTRNEAGAGHAAEGYARAGHRLGVALVTAGGGLTNAITPIANAWMDRTPVLFLTGSGTLRDDETNTLQAGLDQVAIAAPITKWAKRVQSTDHIPRLIAQAIRVALTPPCGPVLLDLPWDVLTNMVEEADVGSSGAGDISFACPSDATMRSVLQRITDAKRPVIIIGSEASRRDSASSIQRLVKAVGVPVFSDFEGLNQISGVAGDCYGGLLQGLNGLVKHGAEPDLVVLMGVRWGLHTSHGSPALLPAGAEIIQIDPDSRELGRLRKVSHGICADVGATLDELARIAEEMGERVDESWPRTMRTFIDRRLEMIRAQASTPAEGAPMHPFRASEIVARELGPDCAWVLDGALTYLWFTELLSDLRPRSILCHGYLGSMGIGMGTALGAQAAVRPAGRRTVLVTGDGAVGFGLAEFDAMVRHKLPVIVIVMNNQSWGATQHFQKLAVGANRITKTMLPNGRYDQAAAAFGVTPFFVDDEASLESALKSALACDGPVCINVMIDLNPIPPEELLLIGIDPFADAPAEAGDD
ncbi:thiamine pyrophosphate-binding protein [Novosphingobium sp.]|uniref:thiamine pyrophosphate-binding protein n=1 Tax=Novosphingobium sp. TaxID=1874826 RepID=UPI003566367B